MRLLIACLLMLPMTLAARAGVETWQRSYPVTGMPTVLVHVDDSPIVATVWNQPKVEVTVTLIRSGWCSLTMDRVHIHGTQNGNRIEVEVHSPGVRFVVGRCGLATTIHLPAQANLQLNTGDGHIQVAGVHGSLTLSSGDGAIHANGADGDLRADTGDGEVQADGRFSMVHLRSGDGSIQLRAVAGSRMDGLWDVETGDGSVELWLPQDFSARIDAHTGDGGIHSQLPVAVTGTMDRQTLRGTLHEGATTLRIRSGDGSIRLAGS